jgi:hypothetical protein
MWGGGPYVNIIERDTGARGKYIDCVFLAGLSNASQKLLQVLECKIGFASSGIIFSILSCSTSPRGSIRLRPQSPSGAAIVGGLSSSSSPG